MITLESLLRDKKYRQMSFKHLWAVIGNQLEFGGFKRLPGVLTDGKTKLLYRKWHRRPYNTKVAAARRVGPRKRVLPGAPTARANCRVSARAKSHGGQHVAAGKLTPEQSSVARNIRGMMKIYRLTFSDISAA